MNNKPVNKDKPGNIKCEHCKHFAESSETRWGFPIMKCKCQDSKWRNEEGVIGTDANVLSGTNDTTTQPRKAVQIMREILFRGKAVNLHNGSKYFVYGQYVQNRDGKMIYSDTWEDGIQKHYVIEGTVGQYTGLTDKNGKKIFEGDIVKAPIYYDIGCYPHTDTKIIVVKIPDIYKMRIDGSFEIIGNIHDTPELMKGGE